MASSLKLTPGHDTISDVLRALVKRSGKDVAQIINDTKLPTATVYSLYNRNSKVANIRTLQVLANYFGEDLTIFCGLAAPPPPRKLTPEQEQILYQYDTLTDDAKLQVLGLLNRLHRDPENVARLI